jgi:hypothetical protein
LSAARQLTPEVQAAAVAGASLEWRLTNPHAFGLTTASPLQRAICRVADGRPLGDLARHPDVVKAFGDVSAVPRIKPLEVVLLSGIRTAKSLIAACAAVDMALKCDMSTLRHGEVPRVSVVSLQKDLADVILNHIIGSVTNSPLLAPMVIGEPATDGLFLRHPSGRPVQIKVVAGSRAGSTLVARWSAGCIFDEFPRMVGGDDAVVNWDDSRDAVLLRLLPGAQIWHIGSPWAPYGPAYQLVTENWGKPTDRMVVIRAPAPAMNPVYWTPERVEAAKADPDVYRTDVMAEFATPEEALFSAASVDACTRKEPVSIGPQPGHQYYAAMDPATRGNGWTLAIATRSGGKTVVVRADEWVGTKDAPLDPGKVLAEIAGILLGYGLTAVDSDQWMGDALVALGHQVGLRIVPWRLADRERTERYLAIRTRMDSNELELPPIPRLRTDLLHLRKRVTPGGVSVVLPQTSDGRHCDFAPALMLVLSRLLPEAKAPEADREDAETRRMREQVLARWRGRREDF